MVQLAIHNLSPQQHLSVIGKIDTRWEFVDLCLHRLETPTAVDRRTDSFLCTVMDPTWRGAAPW